MKGCVLGNIQLSTSCKYVETHKTQGPFRVCTCQTKAPQRQTLQHSRVVQSAGIGELDSSIAKDLIDSKDPKHTQFCSEIAFVAIYTFFRDDIYIL